MTAFPRRNSTRRADALALIKNLEAATLTVRHQSNPRAFRDAFGYGAAEWLSDLQGICAKNQYVVAILEKHGRTHLLGEFYEPGVSHYEGGTPYGDPGFWSWMTDVTEERLEAVY